MLKTALSQITYLGHHIGAGRQQPDPEKLRAIETIASPKTKTSLKTALSLFNYYHKRLLSYMHKRLR